MTRSSNRAIIAYSAISDLAELHEEAPSRRTGVNTAHSETYRTDYIVRQTLIFAAPGSPEPGAVLLHAP